jgi:hypothetical protein
MYWAFQVELYEPFGTRGTTPLDYYLGNRQGFVWNYNTSTVTLTRSDLVYGTDSFENKPDTPAISYVLTDTTPRQIGMGLLPRFPNYPQTTPDYGYLEALGAQKYELQYGNTTRTYYDYPVVQKNVFFAVHFFYASTRPSFMDQQTYDNATAGGLNCFIGAHYFSATWKLPLEGQPEYSRVFQSSLTTGFSGQQYFLYPARNVQRYPSFCFDTRLPGWDLRTQQGDWNFLVSSAQLVNGNWVA